MMQEIYHTYQICTDLVQTIENTITKYLNRNSFAESPPLNTDHPPPVGFLIDTNGNLLPQSGGYTGCTQPIRNTGQHNQYAQQPDIAHLIGPQSISAGATMTIGTPYQNTTAVQSITQPIPHITPNFWVTSNPLPMHPANPIPSFQRTPKIQN